MTELSPAAKAVMNAYMDEDRAGRLAVAAVLRAVAEQLAYGHGSWGAASAIINEDELLAIANEMENYEAY